MSRRDATFNDRHVRHHDIVKPVAETLEQTRERDDPRRINFRFPPGDDFPLIFQFLFFHSSLDFRILSTNLSKDPLRPSTRFFANNKGTRGGSPFSLSLSFSFFIHVAHTNASKRIKKFVSGEVRIRDIWRQSRVYDRSRRRTAIASICRGCCAGVGKIARSFPDRD